LAFPDPSQRSLAELWSLKGRGAVVTGAAAGIGRASARRLAEAGASVLLVDRDARALESAAAQLAGPGRQVEAEVADVADPAAVARVAGLARRRLPWVHTWVNSAVTYDFGRATELSDQDWDRSMATNLRGVFACCREAGRLMAELGRGGVIVNVTSTEAHRGMPRTAAYVAAKHGVLGLSRSLAIELGRYDVRVLTVAPTLTETEGMASTLSAMGEEGRQRWCDRLPAARIAVPDDVARVVLFAASDMSAMMTGSVLMVDGGEMVGVNRMRLL